MLFPLLTEKVALSKILDTITKWWNDHDQGARQWNAVNGKVFTVPNAALSSSSIPNGYMQIWVDEVGNKLTFQVVYSNGTVKNGTVALV